MDFLQVFVVCCNAVDDPVAHDKSLGQFLQPGDGSIPVFRAAVVFDIADATERAPTYQKPTTGEEFRLLDERGGVREVKVSEVVFVAENGQQIPFPLLKRLKVHGRFIDIVDTNLEIDHRTVQVADRFGHFQVAIMDRVE